MAIYDSVGLHEIRGFDPSYRARGRSARTGRLLPCRRPGTRTPVRTSRARRLRGVISSPALPFLLDEQHQALLGELALVLRGLLSGVFLAGNQQYPRAKPADAAHLKSG
jgi:hypothetical protein